MRHQERREARRAERFFAISEIEQQAREIENSIADELPDAGLLRQARKGLLDQPDADRVRRDRRYLGICADLLGLVSALAGHYAREDAALSFSGMTGTIHARANELKINIQLKILQGGSVPA